MSLALASDFLLNNKWILGAIGAAIAALAVYLRGYSQGRSAIEANDLKMQQLIADQIKSTEVKNQEVEQKRVEDAEAVINTSGISNLIGMWDRLNKKAPSDTPPKDS